MENKLGHFFKKEILDRILLVIYSAYMVISMCGFLNLIHDYHLANVIHISLEVCCALVCCVGIANIVCKRYSIFNFVLIGLGTALFAGTAIASEISSNLFLIVFIGGYCLVDFNKMLKYAVLIHLAALLIITICSLTGIIDNFVFDTIERQRECLGFEYVSYSANFLFYAIIAWVGWRNVRATWAECLALLLCAIFFFIKAQTKNAFILSVLAILIIAAMKLFPSLTRHAKGYGIGTIVLTVVAPVLFVLYSIFGSRSSQLFQTLDDFISGRLSYAKLAYETYGITLFGQPISWVGGSASAWTGEFPADYNYVDSSFMKLLLDFGIVFFVAIIAYLVWIEITATKRKDTFIIIAYMLLILHTTFEPHLLLFEYQPLILGLAYINSRGNIKSNP